VYAEGCLGVEPAISIEDQKLSTKIRAEYYNTTPTLMTTFLLSHCLVNKGLCMFCTVKCVSFNLKMHQNAFGSRQKPAFPGAPCWIKGRNKEGRKGTGRDRVKGKVKGGEWKLEREAGLREMEVYCEILYTLMMGGLAW